MDQIAAQIERMRRVYGELLPIRVGSEERSYFATDTKRLCSIVLNKDNSTGRLIEFEESVAVALWNGAILGISGEEVLSRLEQGYGTTLFGGDSFGAAVSKRLDYIAAINAVIRLMDEMGEEFIIYRP